MRTKLTINITEDGKFYKVELQDHYGSMTTVYEPTIPKAMQYALYWSEIAEQRYQANQLHAKAVMEMNKIDKEAGILTGNYDGLD